MKKVLTTILCCLITLMMFAKNEGEPVIAIMADGTRIEGFTKTHLINYMKPDVSTVSISREQGGEETKYTSEEVVELIFPPTPEDSTVVVYHAVKAQKNMPNVLSKNPKPYKKPVYLRLVYNGDKVKGYARPVRDSSYTPSMTSVNYTWMYYYKIDGEDITKAYWIDTKDLIPSMKKVMKFYFREFPGLQKMVDAKEIEPKEFRANPTIVLPLMDAELRSR